MDKIKTAGILYHPLIAPAEVLARELADFLAGQGVSIWLGSSWEEEKARNRMPGTDLVLSVGGDGTILRSVQVAFESGRPIVGVNLGKLGFMTELSPTEAKHLLPGLIAGEGWIDQRSMLQAELVGNPAGQCRVFHALNDIVIARGAVARVINTSVAIDGVKFTNYTADGVIAATATGSTGYSLAAGGPVMYPQSGDFLILPILPHLNLPYPVVLPESAVVEIGVKTPYAATLSIDGHTNIPLPDGSRVTVKVSKFRTRFIRVHPKATFFSTLEQKLKGRKNADPGPESQNG